MTLNEYQWEDCTITIDGIEILGVESIEYDTENPAEYNRGARGEILSTYYTNQRAHPVTLTVKQSVISAIEDALQGGRGASSAVFNITVTYLQNNVLRTDIIEGFRATNAPKSIGLDTAIMSVGLTGIAKNIIYNA